MAVAANGQSNLVMSAFQTNGVVSWTYPTNVGLTSYWVEWALQLAGPRMSGFGGPARPDPAHANHDVGDGAGGLPVVARPPTQNPLSICLVDDYEQTGSPRPATGRP